jgi:starch synthase
MLVTAEYAPLVRTGGLADATRGLTDAVRAAGVDVEVVLPDYEAYPLADEQLESLDVVDWAAPARARVGVHDTAGPITLVDVPAIERVHPYVEPATGQGWTDNDRRFFGFSAAVAALAGSRRPDVLHLNDWHPAATLGLLEAPPPSVLTIHNLAYQGNADAGWLTALGPRAAAYERYGQTNALAGAIQLADRIVAVSPTYARDITGPEAGMGLDVDLRVRGSALLGIRNGIDVATWDPSGDPHLPARFSRSRLQDRTANTAALREELGLAPVAGPLLGAVSRLVDQKGVDLLLALVPLLGGLDAQMVLLGAGDPALAAAARAAQAAEPGRFVFREGFDDGLSHRIFGGSDLFVMPSRFEPCGLAQMQAMRYGSIPVVTAVGGLLDTVTDADRGLEGTGFVAVAPGEAGWVDALHRAVRSWAKVQQRRHIQRAGMRVDWSWAAPAAEHVRLYESLAPKGEHAGRVAL